MTATLTPRERELARHALGLDGSAKVTTRNCVIVSEDDGDLWTWIDMTCRLLAIRKRQDDRSWRVRLTRAGAEAALEAGETLDEGNFPR